MENDKENQTILVAIRIRPLNKMLSLLISELQKQHKTHLLIANNSLTTHQNKTFHFDQIYDHTTSQQTIFQDIGKTNVEKCILGYNCCIFAYGQTGTGKTHTIFGNIQQPEQAGLLPRSIEYLFERLDEQNLQNDQNNSIIKCTYLQIYNEQIYDLLGSQNANLQIRQDIKKGVYVQNITEQVVCNGQQAMEILKTGSRNRHVGSTAFNIQSSRSHSVFTISVESKRIKNGLINYKNCKFNFVDLAGSQRTKLANIHGQRLKEGCNINKSLHILGNVINSLAESSEGKSRHIHYRDSKLTFLLKDSLGGNSKTQVIANLSPSLSGSNETLSTLKFARSVKMIKKSKAHINQDNTGNLQALKQQLKRLKCQLNLYKLSKYPQQKQTLAINPETKNDKIVYLQKILREYLNNSIQAETKLHRQALQKRQALSFLKTGMSKFQRAQINYRAIISLYKQKFKRQKQNGTQRFAQQQITKQYYKFLQDSPYIMSLLSQNLKLKQQNSNLLLEQHLNFLKLLHADLTTDILLREKSEKQFVQTYSQTQSIDSQSRLFQNINIPTLLNQSNNFQEQKTVQRQKSYQIQLQNLELRLKMQSLRLQKKVQKQNISQSYMNKTQPQFYQIKRKLFNKEIENVKISNQLDQVTFQLNKKNKQIQQLLKEKQFAYQKIHFLQSNHFQQKQECQNCSSIMKKLMQTLQIKQKNKVTMVNEVIPYIKQILKNERQISMKSKIQQSQIEHLAKNYKLVLKHYNSLRQKLFRFQAMESLHLKKQKEKLLPKAKQQFLISLVQLCQKQTTNKKIQMQSLCKLN